MEGLVNTIVESVTGMSIERQPDYTPLETAMWNFEKVKDSEIPYIEIQKRKRRSDKDTCYTLFCNVEVDLQEMSGPTVTSWASRCETPDSLVYHDGMWLPVLSGFNEGIKSSEAKYWHPSIGFMTAPGIYRSIWSTDHEDDYITMKCGCIRSTFDTQSIVNEIVILDSIDREVWPKIWECDDEVRRNGMYLVVDHEDDLDDDGNRHLYVLMQFLIKKHSYDGITPRIRLSALGDLGLTVNIYLQGREITEIGFEVDVTHNTITCEVVKSSYHMIMYTRKQCERLYRRLVHII
jgi:hypothetical protein